MRLAINTIGLSANEPSEAAENTLIAGCGPWSNHE